MAKTIAELEQEHQMMIAVLPYGTTDQDTMEEKDFLTAPGLIGVDIEPRTAWLKANGYDVTRENLTDANLPTINPEQSN